jgi:hypothetical protein
MGNIASVNETADLIDKRRESIVNEEMRENVHVKEKRHKTLDEIKEDNSMKSHNSVIYIIYNFK